MPMNDAQFKEAFREVISAEFCDVPHNESDIAYDFSPDFKKRMQKLIKSEKSALWHLFNTRFKKAAVIFIVFSILFTTACSVKSIREPIVNFFVEIYEKFTHFIFEGELKNEIETEYSPSYLPKGFSKISTSKEATMIITTYGNEAGQIIEFSQIITDDIDLFFDVEKGNINELSINGITAEIYKSEDFTQAAWTCDSYVITISCFGSFSDEDIYKIIESVKAN